MLAVSRVLFVFSRLFSFPAGGGGTGGSCIGGAGRGELLLSLLFFVRSWRGLIGGCGCGESGRGFVIGSGKETGGLGGLGGAGAGAGTDLLVVTGGRGAGGLAGLAEPRAKTESDLVLLVLVLFEAGERGSGTGALMGLWLLASRGAGIGDGGGGTDFAGGTRRGSGGGDFDGLGGRTRGIGGGRAGLGGVCGLCGLTGLFTGIELVDPCALALALAIEGAITARAGRGGGGEFGITSIWRGGEGSGPACDVKTGGIEMVTW